MAYRFNEGERCGNMAELDDSPIAGRGSGELLSWLGGDNLLMRSIGLATANALIHPPDGELIYGDIRSLLNFEPGMRTVMVGYFEPLVAEISKRCHLEIYEIDTSLAPGLKDSSEAPQALGRCDIALITSTAIVNGTIDQLLQAATGCREVAILGPSTPLLTEVFAGTSVTLLSGVEVTNPEILRVVSEGGGMQQFKPYVRKVNCRPKILEKSVINV